MSLFEQSTTSYFHEDLVNVVLVFVVVIVAVVAIDVGERVVTTLVITDMISIIILVPR